MSHNGINVSTVELISIAAVIIIAIVSPLYFLDTNIQYSEKQTDVIKNVTNATNSLINTISHGVASPQAEEMYKHQTQMIQEILNIMKNKTR